MQVLYNYFGRSQQANIVKKKRVHFLSDDMFRHSSDMAFDYTDLYFT
jgi:hypothetical protein